MIMEGSRRDEKARFTSTTSCCLVCWRIAHCIVAHLNGMQNCLLSFTHMDGAGTVICFKTFHQSLAEKCSSLEKLAVPSLLSW